MERRTYRAGIDVGSTTVKLAVLDGEGNDRTGMGEGDLKGAR